MQAQTTSPTAHAGTPHPQSTNPDGRTSTLAPHRQGSAPESPAPRRFVLVAVGPVQQGCTDVSGHESFGLFFGGVSSLADPIRSEGERGNGPHQCKELA